jgi:hypothetical protein
MRVLSNLDADLNRITSLAAPVEDMDAVSKAYVEDVSQGIYEDLFTYVIATGQLSTLYDKLSSGWASAQTLSGAEGWTYVSPTSFSIDGDKRDKYQKGDKIRLTQGGDWKYFYITGVSYSAPNTTITITGGSEYTLVSAAITDNYYSKAMNPQGWPISLGQRVGDKRILHIGTAGETLWSGSWESGAISVPAALNYYTYRVRIGTGSYPINLLVFRGSNNYCYGANFDTNNSVVCIFSINSAGDMNRVHVKSMTHTPSGSHGALSDAIVSEIAGLW